MTTSLERTFVMLQFGYTINVKQKNLDLKIPKSQDKVGLARVHDEKVQEEMKMIKKVQIKNS